MNKKETERLFINGLNSIERQYEKDEKFAETIKELNSNGYPFYYDYSAIHDSLLTLLKEIVNDTEDFVEWFIFDTNFGKENNIAKINNEEFIITSPKELYDYILKIKEYESGNI